jgi:hypothetical protein
MILIFETPCKFVGQRLHQVLKERPLTGLDDHFHRHAWLYTRIG